MFLCILIVDILCGMDAFHPHSMWNPCGLHVEWRPQNEWNLSQNVFHIEWWTPCGLHVEWRPQNEWNLSQDVFHMEWWTPCGLHVDIPLFHVEWRPQNEWNLSQNVFHMEWWTPCGVHVECGGRVKTSMLLGWLSQGNGQL